MRQQSQLYEVKEDWPQPKRYIYIHIQHKNTHKYTIYTYIYTHTYVQVCHESCDIQGTVERAFDIDSCTCIYTVKFHRLLYTTRPVMVDGRWVHQQTHALTGIYEIYHLNLG